MCTGPDLVSQGRNYFKSDRSDHLALCDMANSVALENFGMVKVLAQLEAGDSTWRGGGTRAACESDIKGIIEKLDSKIYQKDKNTK